MQKSERWGRGSGVALVEFLILSLSSWGLLVGCPGEHVLLRADGGVQVDDDPLLASECGEVGLVECHDSALEACERPASGGPPSWVRRQDCGSPALCQEDPARCLPAACSRGQTECFAAEASRCSSDLTAWRVVDTCISEAHCFKDESSCDGPAPCCKSEPCQSGELRCSGGELQVCRTDRSAWETLLDCGTNELCEAGRLLAGCGESGQGCECGAPACEAGRLRCEGQTLVVCSDGRDQELFVEECESEALCQLSLNDAGRRCRPPACSAPGGFQCNGAELMRCSDDLTSLELVAVCADAGLCDATSGACGTRCEVGETRCNGTEIVRCRDDGSSFEPVPGVVSCATPQLCQPTEEPLRVACVPPECDVGEFQCRGGQLEVCNAFRTRLVPLGEPCERATLCSAVRERCDFCEPGALRCSADLGTSRLCDSRGDAFAVETPCPLGCVAETGACRTCEIGEYRCTAGGLARCDDGISFAPLGRSSDCAGSVRMLCEGDQLSAQPCGQLGCNATRSACNECASAESECVSTQSLRSCQPNGTFGAETACAAGMLCSQGACVCTPGQTLCDDEALLECNSFGDAFVAGSRCGGAGNFVLRSCDDGELTTNTCASASLCAAATGSECPECLDGQRDCFGNPPAPRLCIGGQLQALPACAAGLSCVAAGQCRCAPGALRCQGGALLACDDDGETFESVEPCSGATLRLCVAGQPSSQICGSAALCEASGSSGCAECLPGTTPECSGALAERICVNGSLVEIACGPGEVCVAGQGCQAAD